MCKYFGSIRWRDIWLFIDNCCLLLLLWLTCFVACLGLFPYWAVQRPQCIQPPQQPVVHRQSLRQSLGILPASWRQPPRLLHLRLVPSSRGPVGRTFRSEWRSGLGPWNRTGWNLSRTGRWSDSCGSADPLRFWRLLYVLCKRPIHLRFHGEQLGVAGFARSRVRHSVRAERWPGLRRCASATVERRQHARPPARRLLRAWLRGGGRVSRGHDLNYVVQRVAWGNADWGGDSKTNCRPPLCRLQPTGFRLLPQVVTQVDVSLCPTETWAIVVHYITASVVQSPLSRVIRCWEKISDRRFV